MIMFLNIEAPEMRNPLVSGRVVNRLEGGALYVCRCRIPDDWIDKKRYPLFMARDVLRGLVQSLQSTGKP